MLWFNSCFFCFVLFCFILHTLTKGFLNLTFLKYAVKGEKTGDVADSSWLVKFSPRKGQNCGVFFNVIYSLYFFFYHLPSNKYIKNFPEFFTLSLQFYWYVILLPLILGAPVLRTKVCRYFMYGKFARLYCPLNVQKNCKEKCYYLSVDYPPAVFWVQSMLTCMVPITWHRLVCQIFSVQILLSIVSFHSFCLHHNPDIFSYCFSLAGGCTWGNSCRFLHPGHNDKGMVKNSVLLSLASSVIVEMHAKSRI